MLPVAVVSKIVHRARRLEYVGYLKVTSEGVDTMQERRRRACLRCQRSRDGPIRASGRFLVFSSSFSSPTPRPSTTTSPLIHRSLVASGAAISHHTSQRLITMSMFRTALRSSARAAGALSASSRIAFGTYGTSPVATELQWRAQRAAGNSMPTAEYARRLFERCAELLASCAAMASTSEVASGTAR